MNWLSISLFLISAESAGALQPNDQSISIGDTGKDVVQLRDQQETGGADDAKPLLTIKEGADGTTSLAFSADGKVLAAGSGKDGKVRFWEIPSGKPLKQVLYHPSALNIMHDTKIAFSPDGTLLASMRDGKDNGVRIWDWQHGREVGQVKDVFYVGDIAFTPDGKTLLVLDARNIILFDIAKKETRRVIPYGDGAYDSFIAVSPDGKRAAVNGFGFSRIRIFDLAQAKEEKMLKTEVGFCTALYWTKDGKSLITFGVGHWISYRSLDSGEVVKKLGEREGGFAGPNPTIAVSPDEKLVVAADRKLQMQVWDVEAPAHKDFEGHRIPVFSRDGKKLAATVHEKNRVEIRVWDVPALAKMLK
jgi:WD40 repeat protein